MIETFLPTVTLYRPGGSGGTGSLPARETILRELLRGDIAPTYIPRLVLGIRGDGKKDILGTWSWFMLNDADFAAVASAYRAAGGILQPSNIVIEGYQGITFDYRRNLPEVVRLLDRSRAHGLLPALCLQTEKDGNGDAVIAYLPQLFDAVDGHCNVFFTGWEVNADGNGAYTTRQHETILRMTRERFPDAVILVEFDTPGGHDPIVYEGPACPYKEPPEYNEQGERLREEAEWYYRNGPGRYVDVIALRLCYERLADPHAWVNDVGGCVCRFQELFTMPTHWPDGSPVEPGILNNCSGPFYHLPRPLVICAFEYASWTGMESQDKDDYRILGQAMIPPFKAWGEG